MQLLNTVAWRAFSFPHVGSFAASVPPEAGSRVVPVAGTHLYYGDSPQTPATITKGLRIQAAPIFQFLDGSYGVDTREDPLVVQQDYPASDNAGADGFYRNGMMLGTDIQYVDDATQTPQGWDELTGVNDSTVSKPTFSTVYSDALNVSPTRTGSDTLVAAAGQAGCAVKVKRLDTIAQSSSKWSNGEILTDVMVVSAVTELPWDDAVRPPYIGTIASLIRYSEANFNAVRTGITFPAHATQGRTPAQSIAWLENIILPSQAEGEKRRGLCIGEGYSQRIMKFDLAQAALNMINPATSETDRQRLFALLAVRCTDIIGVRSTGITTNGGAGQRYVDGFVLSLMAAICPTRTDIHAYAVAENWNANDQSRWMRAEDVGGAVSFQAPGTASASDLNALPGFDWMVGHPQWTSGSLTSGHPLYSIDFATTARYRALSTNASMYAIGVLGMISGAVERVYGDVTTWDNANNRFASLALLEQARTKRGNLAGPSGTNAVEEWMFDLYDAVRPNITGTGASVPTIVQPPFQLCYDLMGGADNAMNILNATPTGANMDYRRASDDGVTPYTGSLLPITGRQYRWSHDGVQWSAPVDIGVTADIPFTGARYIQERRAVDTPQLWCGWSLITPLYEGTGSAWRSRVTGAAIPVGAPVQIEDPKVYQYRWSETSFGSTRTTYPEFAEMVTTWPVDKELMVVGTGLYADGISDTVFVTPYLRVNGGAETVLTHDGSTTFARPVSALSSAGNTREVRFDVRVEDASGNQTTRSTPWITMPQVPTVTWTFTDTSEVTPVESGGTFTHDAGGFYHVVPTVGGSYGGISFPFVGVTGVTYRADIDLRDVNTAFRISARAFDDMAETNSVSTNHAPSLGNNSTRLMSLDFVANGAEQAIKVRRHGEAVSGDWYDVTGITFTPII